MTKPKTPYLICCSSFFLLFMAACTEQKNHDQSHAPVPEIAIWIAETPIPIPELSQEFKLFLLQRGLEYPQSKQDFDRLLNDCIEDLALSKALDWEGKQRNVKEQISSSDVAGLSQEPDEFPEGFEALEKDRKAWRDRVRKQMLSMEIVSAISDDLVAGFEVSQQVLQTEYDARKPEFAIPVELEVRVIKVPNKDLAEDLHAKLKNGWDFIKLAAQYSVVRGKGEKGEVYKKPIRDFPEAIQQELLALARTKYSSVCEYAGNYSIYYLENKNPERILSLDEVQDNLKREIISRERSRRYREWTKGQIDAMKIRKGTPLPFEGVTK